jgi:membrane protein
MAAHSDTKQAPVLDDKQKRLQPNAADKERARQPGRGRQASKPTEIPARGWKDILLRTKDDITNNHLQLIAAGFTFYALLSLFPMIAALVSIYGLIRTPGDFSTELDLLSGILPSGALDIIRGQLAAVTTAGQQKLGFAFLFSLLVSLWSANQGFTAMFEAMNIAYGEREKRSWFKRTGLTLAFTAGGILFLIIALSVIVALPPFLKFIGLESVSRERSDAAALAPALRRRHDRAGLGLPLWPEPA